MVFSYMVRNRAKEHLETILKAQAPGALTLVLRDDLFDKWVELATHRCNQLDMGGYIKSQWALYKFIEDAAEAYASRMLHRYGEYTGITTEQVKA